MKVEWSRGAHADVERLWAFLSDRDADYADRVERRLEQAGKLLGTYPRLGRPSGKNGTHLWSVPQVQYILEYEVDDERVLILRVWNTRQNREDL